jgi:Putative DNA-binding domain
MAPRMLFTYRVWGSTRMGDREFNWERGGAADLTKDNLRTLTEIALGLFSRGAFTYNDKHFEIGYEIYDSLDLETTPDDYKIVPPVGQIVRRTSRKTYEEFSVYIREIRESLRNVALDLDKFNQQRELYESDDFWREFIDKARRSKIAEPKLWDFKQTINVWHVREEPARREAKVMFAEDVASFANTRGGVLVVGVSDAREVVGIGNGRDLENKLRVASDVLAEFLEYRRDIVSFRQVPIGDRRDVICLVIVISAAISPAGVSDGQGRFSYPIRRETGIARVSKDETPASKRFYEKSESREFLMELRQFIRDN